MIVLTRVANGLAEESIRGILPEMFTIPAYSLLIFRGQAFTTRLETASLSKSSFSHDRYNTNGHREEKSSVR